MKKLFFTLTAFLTFSVLYSQVRVVTSGDVKIGSTSVAPTEKLDVDGNLKIRGSQIRFGQNAGAGDANILIGADRTVAGKSTFTLISATGNVWGTRMFRNSAGFAGFQHRGPMDLQFNTLDAASITFYTNATVRMAIRKNTGQVDIFGAATVNGGVAVTSDLRLKENVQNFELGLEDLLKLNPVSYKYNGKGGTTKGRTFVGLIAQDLQKVVPEFVSDHDFEVKDQEGKTVNTENYLKIHDSEIKYLMVNAIKDQQELITQQSSRIDELENQLAKILTRLESNSIGTKTEGKIEFDALHHLKIYPNPSSGTSLIEYTIPSNAVASKIIITNLDGKKLKEINLETKAGNGKVSLNLNDFPDGNYFCSLYINGENIGSEQIVVLK